MLEITLDRRTDTRITTPDGKSIRITLVDVDPQSLRATIGLDGPRETFKVTREDHKYTAPEKTEGHSRKKR